MIFFNPSGAPELGCDACGCRWFDRMVGTCYECGTPVSENRRPSSTGFDIIALRRNSKRKKNSAGMDANTFLIQVLNGIQYGLLLFWWRAD